jgi:hypothetical protein
MTVPALTPKKGLPKSSFLCFTTGGWLGLCQVHRDFYPGEVNENLWFQHSLRSGALPCSLCVRQAGQLVVMEMLLRPEEAL